MPNTEKPQAKEEKKKIVSNKSPKKKLNNSKNYISKKDLLEKKIEEKPKEIIQEDKKKDEQKIEKKEKIKTVQGKSKIKKTEAIVFGDNLPLSTKYSAAICRFIKNKRIDKAILELEEVLKEKKAIPLRGEIAHKKGVRFASGSGKYPKKATEYFIRLLKSLKANANYNELEEPIIKEAIANIGKRPFGKFGKWRRKRSHIKIIAKEKQKIKQKSKEKK
jgi:large subunit ribosomal protein L22